MDANTVKSIDLSLICQPPGLPKTKKDEEKRELRQTFSYDFNVTKISQLNSIQSLVNVVERRYPFYTL